MITLTEAFKLCHIRDDEIVYLRPENGSRFSAQFYLGKQVRDKLDMKHTQVVGIDARFSYGGDFAGMEFTIKRKEKESSK